MAYAVRLDSLGALGAILNTLPSMVTAFVATGPGLRRIAYHYLVEAVSAIGDVRDDHLIEGMAARERAPVVGTWAGILSPAVS